MGAQLVKHFRAVIYHSETHHKLNCREMLIFDIQSQLLIIYHMLDRIQVSYFTCRWGRLVSFYIRVFGSSEFLPVCNRANTICMQSTWLVLPYAYWHIEAEPKWSTTRICIRFLEWKLLYFDSNLTLVCSQWSNWQRGMIGWDGGLATNRRRAINWTDDGWPSLLEHICVNRLNELTM